jgi:hypothetical protein
LHHLCVGWQGIYDSVNVLLRCGCSRYMLDKKDKSYVCLEGSIVLIK